MFVLFLGSSGLKIFFVLKYKHQKLDAWRRVCFYDERIALNRNAC